MLRESVAAQRKTAWIRLSAAILVLLPAATAAHQEQREPPPVVPLRANGAFLPRMTSAAELAPGVRVTLAPGQPPAVLLENLGADPVVVLGERDEPFLRISRDGVDGNLASATWRELRRYRGPGRALAPAGRGVTQWRRISRAPRYSWSEPRAAGDSGNARWQVPLMIGARRAAIAGVIEWVPAQ